MLSVEFDVGEVASWLRRGTEVSILERYVVWNIFTRYIF